MVAAISFQNKSLIQANHRFPELTLRGGLIQDLPGRVVYRSLGGKGAPEP